MLLNEFISLIPYWAGVLLAHLFFIRKDKKLGKEIVWASFRTTLQLILLAFALQKIFTSHLFIVSLLVSLFMTLNSSLQIVSRSKTKILHLFWITLISNTFAIWPLAFALSMDMFSTDWSEPSKLLTFMGMLLGNTLSGISIGIENFMQNFTEKKEEVLSLMSLGATKEECTERFFYRALKAGINPQINSMISMGIVSIPGMMAGQLVAGTSPLFAALLQVKMMIVICLGTCLATYIALQFVRRGLFLPTGELCLK